MYPVSPYRVYMSGAKFRIRQCGIILIFQRRSLAFFGFERPLSAEDELEMSISSNVLRKSTLGTNFSYAHSLLYI